MSINKNISSTEATLVAVDECKINQKIVVLDKNEDVNDDICNANAEHSIAIEHSDDSKIAQMTMNVPSKSIKKPNKINPKTISSPNEILVIWDFDWSMINENSDYYPFTHLNSTYDRTNALLKATEIGCQQFIDFQNAYSWPYLFKEHSLDAATFSDVLHTIPVYDECIHIVHTLHIAHPKCKQLIISNANTVLVESILQGMKAENGVSLFPNVFKSDEIYSNPGWYDQQTGILRCDRYHNKHESYDNKGKNLMLSALQMHNCKLCPVNLCKGKVLIEEVLKRDDIQNWSKMSGGKNKSRVMVYIGDGAGDYCPVTKLGYSDFAFVRVYEPVRGLQKCIESDDGIQLKCSVFYWKDGKEILNCFERALPSINF